MGEIKCVCMRCGKLWSEPCEKPPELMSHRVCEDCKDDFERWFLSAAQSDTPSR